MSSIFYNQPLSARFGSRLVSLLSDPRWSTLDAGVAWVRRSGLRHLRPAVGAFLRRGGVLRLSVGLDMDNTSQEGLEDLLSLRSDGDSEIYVYHNESTGVFHPKVYLLSNATHAKLIVGSNNLTEAGLFVNVEAGIELDAPVGESIIREAKAALESWRDPSLDLARKLDDALLAELVRLGYVRSEAAMAADTGRRRSGAGGGAGGSERLFGRLAVTAPPAPADTGGAGGVRQGRVVRERPFIGFGTPSAGDAAGSTEPSTTGRVLLMRVRKAHATDRPTQTQLPKRVYEDPFFAGVTELTSAHDGQTHDVNPAMARGIVNTLKLEIPEMRHLNNPVVRFERTPVGVVYQVFDASSVRGQQIMAALQHGRTLTPPQTHLTRPRNPGTSTWWRFI